MFAAGWCMMVKISDSSQLSKLCNESRLVDGLHAAHQGLQVSSVQGLCNLLKECSRKKDLAAGREIRSFIQASGFGSNCSLRAHLIRLFSSAGSLLEAVEEFQRSPQRDSALWTAIISAHARNGQGFQAIRLYHQMLQSSEKPSIYTYAAVLNACASTGALQEGRIVHSHIAEMGFESELLVGNSLVNMYSKCGLLGEARRVFLKLTQRDLVSWNSIIAGCVQHGHCEEAFQYFEKMKGEGLEPDRISYLSMLKACSSMGTLDRAKIIHKDLLRIGATLDVFLGSALVDMYAKFGLIDDARKVFATLPERNVVLWTTMIAGLVQNGCGQEAIHLFEKMQEEEVKPNKVTFVCVLKACGSISALEWGKIIHNQIIESGFESDSFVGNTLIDMYAKCRSIENARQVFCKLPKRDVVSWNAMISGCVQNGHGEGALKLFEEMQQEGLKPNKVTFLGILKACSNMESLEQGKRIHEELVKSGIKLDLSLGNVLVDMYGKCGCIDQAYQVFLKMSKKDVVSWSAMIDGFAQQSQGQKAIELFEKMQQEHIKPNEITFACVLRACSSSMALKQGKLIHIQLKKSGLELDLCLGNTLLDMYVKCGALVEAHDVFLNLRERDVISWSTIINGLVQRGLSHDAFYFFEKMQEEGVRPDKVTYVSILKACGNETALDQGKVIHSQLVESGLKLDAFVANTLIDMYAKCGSMNLAHQVFLKLPVRDLISWNAIIDGYAQQGCGHDAVILFERMLEDDVKPDKVTFVCLLSACSRAGLLNEGHRLFKSMYEEFGIMPAMKHYTCMVDLLGRSGKILEAQDVIRSMHTKPDAEVWMSLLGACRAYTNLEVGRVCFESIVNIEPKNASAYILMSNIYAAAGRPYDEQEIQKRWQSCKGLVRAS